MSTAGERIEVGGMTCAACVRRVERALEKLPSVESVHVNLATGQAAIVPRGRADLAGWVAAVEAAGYTASPLHSGPGTEPAAPAAGLALAIVLSVPVVAVSMLWHPRPTMANVVLAALSAVVVFWCGRSLFANAWRGLRHGNAGMDLLVALGAAAAWGYSAYALAAFRGHHQSEHVYFETGAAIVALILLGRFLEARARGRMSEAVRALLSLAPPVAVIVIEGGEREVESRLLRPGDTVRVPPGQSVPADGTVLEGESDVDESMLTGEPMPVAKGPGDPVTGGSLNGSGSLRVRVERVGADTFLASVQRLVDAAQSSKAPIQNLADRVAAVFVPVIVAVSLGTLAFWLLQGSGTEHAMLASVSVLVIACPCALGLATPTALIVGMGRGSQLGMLVRDGSALQAASAVRAVLFDKTGTLTEGRPKIVAFHALGGWSEDEALAAVAAAEAQSEHPLAAALVEEAVRRGLVLPPATGFQSERGLGASAMVQGSEVRVGRRAFVGGLAESGEASAAAEKLHAQGATVFYAAGARGGAVVAVSDLPAHGARETVAELRRMGMRVAMLTGDGELAARSIARDVGIEEVRAGLLPADKVGAVEEFRRAGPVAMVGDGVNDAPALAAADVGVAMGSGTAAAIESAGVTLLRPDLRLVPAALRLSRATMATIRWNLAWAFGYNVAMVPVAMTGKLSPMLAAAAMAFSSLSVVLNSLRLKRARV